MTKKRTHFFFSWQKKGPSPGPVFDLGTKSRGIKLPRDFNGTFCTGSGNHGTDFFFLYGMRPPRYSPGRDVATMGFKGIFCTGSGPPRDSPGEMQPRRDVTGLFVRDPATAGLCGRDAATAGLNGIFLVPHVLYVVLYKTCWFVRDPCPTVTTRFWYAQIRIIHSLLWFFNSRRSFFVTTYLTKV